VTLQESIERAFELPAEKARNAETLDLLERFKSELNSGTIRSAERIDGVWSANLWVKKGILLTFRAGTVRNEGGQFFDKDTISLQKFSTASGVRIVPGGTSVRDGAFIGRGVVMMPPSYVNMGAYVDENSMIDSHALVGSCAQIGKYVHLSAGAQIGGVLEPVGSLPVIIEDHVLVGGNTGIYEGAIIGRRAVIGAGVILTGSTPVYDLVKNAVYRKTASAPLQIPERAVVVPGSRSVDQPFAREHGIALYAPVIVKYRDEKTDAATALEEALR
jgi:2,3,4,5-tetrahydropyridine-2-carboxylate N-succinyltransferase